MNVNLKIFIYFKKISGGRSTFVLNFLTGLIVLLVFLLVLQWVHMMTYSKNLCQTLCTMA